MDSAITLSLRQEYELTPEQVTEIKDCNFEPTVIVKEINDTPQLRAQAVWEKFAREMKFDLNTLKPVYRKGKVAFSAVGLVMKEKESHLSECCGAEILHWPDLDLCSRCQEHTGVEEESSS